MFHGRNKYIDTRFQFIRVCVENGEVRVTHVCNKEQRADICTKATTQVKHKEMRELTGLKKVINSGLGGEYCHNPDFIECFIYFMFYLLFYQF